MKINKNDILKILEQYDFDPQEYIIISGAALVLQGVKEYTSDIDIAVSNKLYNQILKDYNCQIEHKKDNYIIWFINDVINFSNHYYETVKYKELYGYKVQTLESIIELKKGLNRQKDKKDIEKILNFYNVK
ncbi:MAG: hypothetical protein ACI4WU_01420 [Bacilli bacterium]